jgi:translation initiation factor IF-3
MVGILSKSEAISEAKKAGVDLIEIAPNATPPVAKIIELGKFLYIEEKRAREQKKKGKRAELKEIRFSPFIAEGDYLTRVKKIDNFLADGHKVRIVVVFKGRHMESRPRGYELLKEVLLSLSQEVNTDMEPKFLGRHLAMVVSPLKKRAKTSTIPVSYGETKDEEISS